MTYAVQKYTNFWPRISHEKYLITGLRSDIYDRIGDIYPNSFPIRNVLGFLNSGPHTKLIDIASLNL